MPSKQTQNYHLNQWIKSDKVLMEDFNADNKKIDEAIKAVDAKADGLAKSKADVSALEAETAARTAALSSVNTAVSRLGNCRIEHFTVQSGGSGIPTTIEFSAKPVVFLAYVSNVLQVCHGGDTGERTTGVSIYFSTTSTYTGARVFSWNGFQATASSLDPLGRVVPYNIVAFYAEDDK